jgi:transposase
LSKQICLLKIEKMPRGTYLTETEKGKIMALHEEGCGLREIARKLTRSHKVVSNFLRNPETYGTNKKGGPKKKLSPRTERRLINLSSNSTKSCRKLAHECGANVSRWTILRVLHKSPHIRRQKMKTALNLSMRHKQARLEFAQRNMNRNWSQVHIPFLFYWMFIKHFFGVKVIFSDEKKFNLDGPDGFNCYWRDLRKEPRYFSKRNFGGGGLMIWGGFCSEGVLRLGFPSFRMNSAEYIEVMEANLLPFLANEERAENWWTYQQDNARIHVSREAKGWFQRNNILLLEWPACSPDINPIENLWGIIVRTIYADNRQYDTVQELRAAIVHTWNQIEPNTIRSLIESMISRIFELIRKNGGPTHY